MAQQSKEVEKHDHDDDKHDHNHDQHDHHAHQEKSIDDNASHNSHPTKTTTHTEFNLSSKYSKAPSSSVKFISTQLFTLFPGLEELIVTVITEDAHSEYILPSNSKYLKLDH